MTLAEKIRLQRLGETQRAYRQDELHRRSRFPALELDGADAARHGYGRSACPYHLEPLDGAGRIAAEPQDYPAMRAAWLRGWRDVALEKAAQAVLFCLDSPLEGDVRPLMVGAIAALREATHLFAPAAPVEPVATVTAHQEA